MNSSDQLKDFQDPLLSPLASRRRARKQLTEEEVHTTDNEHRSGGKQLFFLLLIAVAVGFLSYLLYQSNQRIHALSSDLVESQNRLDQVGQELESSAGKIEQLNAGLTESQTTLTTQRQELDHYRNLYTGLKSGQDEQVRTLETINLQKADKEQVEGLKAETSALKQNVEEARADVENLSVRTTENTARIESTNEELRSVQTSTKSNQSDIADIKRSLEREYYNFELQRRGGYMKVFEIALSLKDTNASRRQFDLYLMADGKVIQKEDHPINEPILFYVKDQKKAYEVVVTRVEKDFVVGYLSIPAS